MFYKQIVYSNKEIVKGGVIDNFLFYNIYFFS